MQLKLKKEKVIVIILLIFAVGNATLRFTDNGMSVWYRILSPLFVSIYFFKYITKLKKGFLLMLLVMLYSICVSKFFYNKILIEYHIHIIYIYICYILVKVYMFNSKNFEDSFFKFLDVVTRISLILCTIQYFFRNKYPHVREVVYPGVNIFMWNENELAMPLGLMFILYLYRGLILKKNKSILKIILISIILYINDAKLTIIGIGLGIILLFVYYFEIKKNKRKVKARLYMLIVILILVFFNLLIYKIDPTIQFRNYKITLQELLYTPIKHILTLTPFPDTGASIVVRTNAIIYGIQELLKSNLFGIGFGNTTTMLSDKKYILTTAKSMHNLFFQLLCEFGYLIIGIYILGLNWIRKNSVYIFKIPNIFFKIMTIFIFIIISSQSSIGILSNYYVWIIIFYIILLSNRNQKI